MVVRLQCISCISEFTSWSPYLTRLQRENPEDVHSRYNTLYLILFLLFVEK